jgi:hypothetical protein
LIKRPLPSAVAFSAVLWATLTTFRALPYFRNAAAVRKYFAVLLSGVPNLSARSFSDVTSTTSSIGPQFKAQLKMLLLMVTVF